MTLQRPDPFTVLMSEQLWVPWLPPLPAARTRRGVYLGTCKNAEGTTHAKLGTGNGAEGIVERCAGCRVVPKYWIAMNPRKPAEELQDYWAEYFRSRGWDLGGSYAFDLAAIAFVYGRVRERDLLHGHDDRAPAVRFDISEEGGAGDVGEAQR